MSPFSWMRHRIVFYIAKLLWRQLRSGGSGGEIHEVISIVICDYPLLPEERGYLNEYGLRNTGSGKPFTDLLCEIPLELVKNMEKIVKKGLYGHELNIVSYKNRGIL